MPADLRTRIVQSAGDMARLGAQKFPGRFKRRIEAYLSRKPNALQNHEQPGIREAIQW